MSESYSGAGQLIADGEEHPCQYKLEVYLQGSLKTGDGVVVGTPAALQTAFQARKVRVRMKDGRSFPIIISRYGPGNGDAPFRLAGAIAAASDAPSS